MPSTVATGPVCDVPSDVSSSGTTIISSANSTRSTVIDDGRKSRVVVSEPSSGSRSRFYWRPSDPDGPIAQTQVEGAIDDSSVRK
jgi:hypothetical protein